MLETLKGIPGDIQRQFVAHVNDLFEASSRAHREKYLQYLENLEDYLAELDNDVPEGRANMFDPIIREAITMVVADMLDKLLSPRLQIDIEGRKRTSEKQASAIRNLIRYQAYFHDAKGKIRDEAVDFAIFGTCVAKVCYSVITETIPNPEYFQSLYSADWNSATPETVRKIVYRGADLIPVDIFDFFPHPEMIHIDDDLPVLHRFYPSQRRLLQEMQQGTYDQQNTPKFLAMIHDKEYSRFTDETEDLKRRRREMMRVRPDTPVREQPPCLEFQGPYDINGDGIDEDVIGVIGLAGEGVLLRLEEHPYLGLHKNYVVGRLFPVKGEFWGNGLASTLKSYQDASTGLMRATIDAHYKYARPRIYIERGALRNPKDVEIPWGAVEVNEDPEGKPIQSRIQEMPPVQMGPDAFNLLQMVNAKGQAAGGVSAQSAGRPPGQKQTATLSSQLFAATGLRFKDILEQFEDTFVVPYCTIMHKIAQQFLPPDYVISVLGPQGLDYQVIQPVDIAADVNFISLASRRLIEQPVKAEQLLRAMQIAGQSQMLYSVTPLLFIDFCEVLEMKNIDLLKTMVGYDQMIALLERAKQMNVSPQQLLMMQNQMAGQPPGQVPMIAPGNQTPYGGSQQQTPTNQEEAIAKYRTGMTRNMPPNR